ncbi:alpha/beta fold hydrolase [Nonomuraea wenchangensis]|uniref:alpha/beta fold hydrolase n=1 Tax=Nonomuraea wenchangensis TaxID=568860 RepID=UPI003435F38C
MLVIHGGPDWDHTYLRKPLDQLADRYQLIMPDLRGCGRSTRGLADDQYTPAAATDDLVALLDAHGPRASGRSRGLLRWPHRSTLGCGCSRAGPAVDASRCLRRVDRTGGAARRRGGSVGRSHPVRARADPRGRCRLGQSERLALGSAGRLPRSPDVHPLNRRVAAPPAGRHPAGRAPRGCGPKAGRRRSSPAPASRAARHEKRAT